MIPRKKRRLIIIISILCVLIIIGIVLGILYVKTDMFKSNATLFAKYLNQNTNMIGNVLETKPTEISQVRQNEKYTSNLTAKVEYKENMGSTAENGDNSINKAEVNVSGQTDRSNQYDYKNIRISHENENLGKFESIEIQDIYGIRLNEIKQFTSINKNNTEKLAEQTGISQGFFDAIPLLAEDLDIGEWIHFTAEEKQILASTYLDIINKNTNKDSYGKKANQSMQINNVTYMTNAYQIKMTKEQYNNLKIKILEKVQIDEILLSKIDKIEERLVAFPFYNREETNLRDAVINNLEAQIQSIRNNNIGQEESTITVYESKGQTIRTEMETPEEKITIDLYNNQQAIQIRTQKSEAGKLLGNELIIEKQVDAITQNVKIKYAKTQEGKNISTLESIVEEKKQDNKINSTWKTSYEKDNNQATITVNRYDTVVNQLENKVELTKDNNINLDELEEGQVQNIFNVLKQNANNQLKTITEAIPTRDINIILQKLGLMEEKGIDFTEVEEEEISEIERNRFNSQFSFFIGKDLNVSDLKQMLEIVKGNLVDAGINYKTEENKEPQLENIIIGIKSNSENEKKLEEIEKVLQDTKNVNKRFSVTMGIDENTKLVNRIYIVVEK